MDFANREGLIWLDGKMVPWQEAKVHVLTHTLHYGLGVFCLLYTSPSPRDVEEYRMPSSA